MDQILKSKDFPLLVHLDFVGALVQVAVKLKTVSASSDSSSPILHIGKCYVVLLRVTRFISSHRILNLENPYERGTTPPL